MINDRLILGGAQLGMGYGITASSQAFDSMNSFSILDAAFQSGIRFVDTACGYGDSESIIGMWLSDNAYCSDKLLVTTKSSLELDDFNLFKALNASLGESLAKLGLSSIEAFLLHRCDKMVAAPVEVARFFEEAKQSGKILKAGVSIQDVSELKLALETDYIDVIQLPFNIVERRWEGALKDIYEARQNRGVTIVARSIFLQGLLLCSDEVLWKRAHVGDSIPIFQFLDRWSSHFNISVHRLVMNYVLSQPWIDKVIIGVSTSEEVERICENFGQINFSSSQLAEMEKDRPFLSEETLNPRYWNER